MRASSNRPLLFPGICLGLTLTTSGTPAGFAGAYKTPAMEPLAVVVMYGGVARFRDVLSCPFIEHAVFVKGSRRGV